MVTYLSPLPVAENHARFSALVERALAYASKLGASDAVAAVSEGSGLSVSVRKNDIETVEQTRDRSLEITLYAGQRSGSASTSDFSEAALRETVEAAWHIARYTAEDPAAGLPDATMLVHDYPDLALYSPWSISPEEAADLALRVERAVRETSALITNIESASVEISEGQFVMGNTRGFLGGYPASRHSLSVIPIAGRGNNMQRDFWYHSERDAAKLPAPEALGRYAAERALSRLSARRLRTGRFPILFEAPLAIGLLGALTQAVSGGALYRQASFLVDSLDKEIFPHHIDIGEDPHVQGGLGSAPFDDEGVATHARQVVKGGILQGYFLSTYTARKLGMVTTGNAGGSHNLTLSSRRTVASDDLVAMLKKLDTGLFVTELIGQGVNYVTGDYSRGAFGYWVENGVIQYPVQEVTIAGNLREMFHDIVAVGADILQRGTKCTGSILIEKMAIAGE
jgi:PmbA protein